MVNKYKLVNPYIKGEFETKLDAKNSIDAAKIFYKNLSEHFNNNIPKYYFTIQKGGSGTGKFYHFEVKEKKSNDEVNYSIHPFEIKDGEKAIEQYVENFEKFKTRFNGGARKSSKRKSSKRKSRKDDSESASEDSYDFYREAKSYVPVTSQPLYYMYYDPLVYRLDSVFLPSLYAYATPYSEIATYIPWGPGYSVDYRRRS
jgi:hypothetical protein